MSILSSSSALCVTVLLTFSPHCSPPPSTLEDSQHRMRFITVCKYTSISYAPPHIFLHFSYIIYVLVLCLYAIAADGQALIWEIPAKVPSLPTSVELAISPLLPLARIRDSLGAGITRQDLSFDPETNMLLVRIQEKKIRYSMC